MLRKIQIFIMMVGTIAMNLVAVTYSIQADEINQDIKAAIVVDANEGQILYQKNSEQKYPVASMTKLLTALVLLDQIKAKKISWDTKVVPTSTQVKLSHESGLTNVPLEENHQYTIYQLYQALLVGSANASAMVIAKAVAGNQEDFIKLMKQKSEKLGIYDEEIHNANGLPNGMLENERDKNADKDAENKFSARDMAIIAKALIKQHPEVLKTTSLKSLNFNDQGKKTMVNNTDTLLQNQDLKVDGLKTGTSDAAGKCFVGTANKDGHRIITVVIGAQTDESRFAITQQLMEETYQNHNIYDIKKGQIIPVMKQVKVQNGTKKNVKIKASEPMTLYVGKNDKVETELITKDGKPVKPLIKVNEKLGTAHMRTTDHQGYLNGNTHLDVKVQAAQKVESDNLFIRLFERIAA